MRCGSCDRELTGDFRFCPYCGSGQLLRCQGCGTSLGADFAFCPTCGAARPPISAGAAPPTGRQPLPPRPSQALSRPAVPAVARRGERRVVTVLFADVVGFTKLSEQFDPETLTEMMNRLFERFGGVVRRYDGVVDKFIGDAAMILFGAPIAHEDDAERAVLTARDMMALLPAVNEDLRQSLGSDPSLAIHVGIATGLVVAGAVGSEDGAGYTVMGDAVNLASRLVDLAPAGAIYVSESTHRLVRGRVRAELVQKMHVKGKVEAISVFRVVGVDPSAADPRGLSAFKSPFVGRRMEFERIQAAFERLDWGPGGLILLEGPAGAGKSRVLSESLGALRLDSNAPRVSMGRCISYGRTVPYYPWSQVFAGLLAEGGSHVLAPDELAVLEQVATGAFGNRTRTEAERHRQTVFTAAAKVVAAVSQGTPRILVLEDLHWADSTSIELMGSLLATLGRAQVAVVAVLRSGTGSDVLQALRTDATAFPITHVPVDPMSEPEMRALVANLTCDVAGMDDGARLAIARRSEGLPLFVEEILRGYVDDAVLVREHQYWRYHPDRAAEVVSTVPTTLRAIISARIDRLAPPLRSRLELASVIGKDFDAGLVDNLLDLAFDPQPWQRLEEIGEIEGVPHQGAIHPRKRFTHVLTQDVIYETILKSRRQELHRAVARALEADVEAQDGNLHSLAWHFEQAGLPDRAAPFVLAAARQARDLYANQEALALFERSIRLAPTTAAAREALAGKVYLLGSMGNNADADATCERLVAMARSQGDLAEEARWIAHRASLAYHRGDGPAILALAGEALLRAERSGDPHAIVAAKRQVGVGHEFAGRFADARRAYEELLAIAEQLEGSPHVANTYNSLGEIARASDLFDDAIRWYDKSREVDPRAEPTLSYQGNMGAAMAGKGAFEGALALLDGCIAERRRRGYLSFLSESYFYRGLSNIGLGRLDEAVSDARAALDLADQHRETEMAGLAYRLVALVAMAGGDTGRAGLDADPEQALRRSVDILESSGKRGEEARSRWELGRHLRSAGRADEAARELAQAARLFDSLGLELPARRVEAEATSGRA